MDIEKSYKNYLKNKKVSKFIYLNKPQQTKSNKIALIVPYRDNPIQNRKEHLDKFKKHFGKFLESYNYKIYIIEQANDSKKFNRGKLLNIGINIAIKEEYNILITHDVDLLPSDDLLPYYTNEFDIPVHIAFRWNKYNYKNYFGGIVNFNKDIATKINGYPNDFWGWGGEDDSLYNRITDVVGKIGRPNFGKIKDLYHEDTKKQNRNTEKWENILNDLVKWKSNGLNNLDFNIENKIEDKFYVKYLVNI